MTTLISGEQLTNGHLGKVAVVVALHLEVKHLGLGIARLSDEELVEEVEHVIANVPQLFLHLKKKYFLNTSTIPGGDLGDQNSDSRNSPKPAL